MKNIAWLIFALFVVLCLPMSIIFGAAPPQKTPELLQTGKKLYDVNCTPCHGPKGDGKGPVGSALTPPPTDFTKPLGQWPITKGAQEKIFEVISKGISNTGMVKWDQYSEQERWALVYLIMEFTSAAKKPK